ncbi:MAG: tetratricopeptide repeat protein, partial [Defluviicoccus sp.]|nr:tetratricopeptide repeat protein [Defluviicoccus sp.]
MALALTDDAGFRLAIATFEDARIRDVLIDRLAARLTAAGTMLSCLDVASLVPPDERVARQEFSLLAALRRHYEGLAAGQPGTKIAISVVGLEHFISEFSEGGLNALATANLQRELFPQACPLPVVLWLPPWATTLLAQKAPDLWHWRTATFDFPSVGSPPSALAAWPEFTREEWWRPVDGERLGELAAELEALRQREGTDTSPRARAYAAHLRVRLADALYTRGQLDEAFNLLKEAGAIFAALGDVRYVAVTMGKIADTLVLRGQLDEALRILKEKVLPAFEPLGDVRSRAVTMGKIADVLQARGQLDEALRISKEEELPIYERLGDVRERAVAMGRIAGILQARGQLDEALRIRKEEQLPVYERLGDVRSRAVTMGNIAGILQARGQLEEALRIRKEEVLPAFERLGDVHSRAVAMGQIADIL